MGGDIEKCVFGSGIVYVEFSNGLALHQRVGVKDGALWLQGTADTRNCFGGH